MSTDQWTRTSAVPAPAWPLPTLPVAVGRGLINRCPGCGRTPLFAGFLRVNAECPVCRAPLGLARADDAPPYFTILIVGHIVIPLMLLMQRDGDPSALLLTAIFVPMTLVLSLLLIRPVKGGTVGLMLKLGMLKSAGDD